MEVEWMEGKIGIKVDSDPIMADIFLPLCYFWAIRENLLKKKIGNYVWYFNRKDFIRL